MPKSRGRMVIITSFVGASHADTRQIPRRLHIGFIALIDCTPIMWHGKQTFIMESSTFSSEFIALKIVTETIVGLRFKLQMFGMPIGGPAHILNNCQSVVNDSSKVESTLNEKHSSVAHHLVRPNVASSTASVLLD